MIILKYVIIICRKGESTCLLKMFFASCRFLGRHSRSMSRQGLTYKDRLSRVGYDLFYYLFQKYNCEIVVMSEVGSEKLDSQEIFEEIVNLLHCYSMNLYSSRRRLRKIKEAIEDDETSGTPPA